ncbi:hypothetical protein K469DRAFT_697808 [Zopfia rhizophila CBS 207.26]|uniref:Uncharacterized protein n=1 Tax=Zopfia rhizophila CBS 207.26 TaxID=1314779 RepID=A0A6A6EGB1_9PEZI|nr:hypothetical protein K469DRAFT_697808 [Zopfia rhizophila CBS 207.26]
MKDEEQGWQVLNTLPGNLIIHATKAGCYYSSLTRDETVKKEEERLPASNVARAAQAVKEKRKVIFNNSLPDVPTCWNASLVRNISLAVRNEQSPTSKAAILAQEPVPTQFLSQLKPARLFPSPNPSPGRSLGVCRASIGVTFTSETRTTITTSSTKGSSQTVIQQVGTNAFLAFTPTYECWQGDANCGKDDKGNNIFVPNVDFCQPAMTDDKLSGKHNMVYI